jgi:hypothetical protein
MQTLPVFPAKPLALAAALVLALLFCPAAAAGKTCYTPEQAVQHENKDVCVRAHVYRVVELVDGTRFLDVCPPEMPDDACRFSILSLRADRTQVGDLKPLEGQEIEIRGVIRPFNLRHEMVLSHARQLHGGAEKFHPNPSLIKGFSAEDHKGPISDPAQRGGRHRSVYNRKH